MLFGFEMLVQLKKGKSWLSVPLTFLSKANYTVLKSNKYEGVQKSNYIHIIYGVGLW